MDISKQIDKKGGNDYSKQFAKDLKQARESRNLTMKYCDDKYCNSSTNWSWYEGRKDGCRVPDYQTYLEMIKEFPELEKYKVLIKEAEREVIGKKESGCFNNQEKDRYTIGSSKALEVDITIPSTDLAKKWQGWGTALKPSFEPIIVARKPFKGSLVDNVIQYGVGGINIDECRVETTDINRKGGATTKGNLNWKPSTKTYNDGRFPANTILTYDETDFDEVCGGFPITETHSMGNKEIAKSTGMFGVGIVTNMWRTNDKGSASRYFYNAKASKKDRDEGLDVFEEKINCDRNVECYSADVPFNRSANPKKNTHPTVKPTELMQYLVRLVTPNNGIVLDPFNGSGSTGKAVMYENKERNKNYKYIGIELTEEYLPISKARIEYVINLKEENKIDKSQITIDELMEV